VKRHLIDFLANPVFELTIVGLILLSVTVIIAQAVVPSGTLAGVDLEHLSTMLTYIFIVELSLRWLASFRTKTFFREYWIDILAVAPTLRGFRILRVLRLLRLFRVGKILNRRVRRFSNIFVEGVTEYVFILVLLSVIILSGTLAIMGIEGKTNPEFASFDKAFWWSVYSLMAGEPINGVPATTAGRLVSVFVMFGGVTAIALLTGFFSAFMVHRLRRTMEGRLMELEDLSNHIIICGWNRAGRLIVEEFQSDPTQKDKPIVIVAERENAPHFDHSIVRPELIYFLSADYTQVAVLKRCSVEKASISILLADKSKPRSDQDRDARTVLAAMIIEKLNTDIFTCVELLNRDNETHLQMAGVEDVVVGDEYAGTIIAAASRNKGGIVPVVNEIFTSKYGNQLYKVLIPPTWKGKKVHDAHCELKSDHNAILLSIERLENGKSKSIVNPGPDTALEEGDFLILIANEMVKITP